MTLRQRLRDGARYLPYAVAGVALMIMLMPKRSGPAVGEVAADFDLPVVTGDANGRFHLSEHRGKPVVVEVFASWCGTCAKTSPTVADVATAPRSREVEFIGVSVDDTAREAQAAARAWQVPYAVALDDGSFSRAYDIKLLPTFILIDEQGQVRQVTTGRVSRGKLEGWMTSVGAGRR